MIYRREIDGLRALAVVPVILFHAGFEAFSGGFVGVDVFFVISGYLITTIILAELELDKFSIVNFYERRARRILPALFFVMLACLPFAWFWLLPSDMKIFSQSLVAVSVFVSNILFWRESGYFDTAAELKPLLHTWSLAVEEQFYVVFPVFLLATWRFGKRLILLLLAAFFILSLGIAQWASLAKPAAAFFLLPTRGWELLIGAFAAFYLSKANGVDFDKRVSEFGGWLGVALIFYAVFAYSKSTPFPGLYALVPTVGTVLIILFATKKTTVGKFVGNRAFVAIGLISYSAYLWHQPVFAFARHRSLNEPSKGLLSVLTVASFVLAYFSWKYVEAQFRHNRSFNRIQVLIFAVVIMALLAALGFAGSNTNGYKNRFDESLNSVLNTKNDGNLKECQEGIFGLNGETCYIGDPSKFATVAVVGDSHATRITSSFSSMLKDEGLLAVVYAAPWCPPLIDVATDNVFKYPKCREYRKESFRHLLNSKSVQVVFMVAEWPNYTQGFRGSETDITYYTDAYTDKRSLVENSEVVKRGLLRTVKSLIKAGKQVVIVKTVPEYYKSIPYLMAKSYMVGSNFDIGIYKQTHKSYRQRNFEILEILEDNYLSTNVSLIDTEELYCPNSTCEYKTSGNEPFYFDGSHLTKVGSEVLVKNMMEHVK